MMKQTTGIEVRDLSFTIQNTPLLRDICLQVHEGEFVGLIGPNGSGKTSLLKNVYRVFHPTAGAVYINGRELDSLKPREAACMMAVLPQESNAGADFSVMEIVKMGRFARKQLLDRDTESDLSICLQALKDVGASHLRDRDFPSLSGGEKQRVLLASAFAQQSPLIVLDEPTNHLDIGYQLQLLDILKQRQGITVFSSLHDLNMAARYCDRVIALNHGQIAAMGTPQEVLTPELIEELFQVRTTIVREPVSGRPQFLFTGSTHGGTEP